MANFQPPPTYANPVVVDETTGKATFHPVWLKWFLDLTGVLNSVGGGAGTISHNGTSGKQGGTTNEFYHLTEYEHQEYVRSLTSDDAAVDTTLIPSASFYAVRVTATGHTITLPFAAINNPGREWLIILGVDGNVTIATQAGDSFVWPNNPTSVQLQGRGSSIKVRCVATNRWAIIAYSGDLAVSGEARLSGYLEVATASTPTTPASGKMRIYAQDASGVARLRALHSTGSDLAFFRDSVVRVKNTSGGTINKGELVYFTGATGNFPTIAKARANAASTMPCTGMVLATATDNSFTTVQWAGEMTGLDTSAFSEGDRVFVSSATAGALTATEPTHPNLSQQVGIVTKANAGDGRIHLVVSLQHEGDDFGTNRNAWSIGDAAAGAKTLLFVNTFVGTVSWQPTANRTLTLPDATGTVALTNNKLSAFAATTSAELAGVISDETGSGGALVFAASPTIVSPAVGTGGTYQAGSLYSDANWGMIIRMKQASPANAEFRLADASDAELLRITTAKHLELQGTIKTLGYTVATLPAAGTVGRIAYVTDALAPAFLTVIAGGGAVKTPVFDNGTNWVAI